jgi:hypothetical protein
VSGSIPSWCNCSNEALLRLSAQALSYPLGLRPSSSTEDSASLSDSSHHNEAKADEAACEVGVPLLSGVPY